LKTRSPHGRTNVGNLVGGHPPNCLTSPTILTHHKQTIPDGVSQSGTSLDFAAQAPGSANAVRDDRVKSEGVLQQRPTALTAS
ncbi:MAG: hypothetical protein O9286_12695, partial [Aquidulcibacter sp.]|uniref:hypothetical protein n=1 Tax=Aquidulcibacter sp. TaxID=2052990 RepID=UPI0022BD12BA|nr:hypothetical protein [Aquidulcibacter sp.]